MSKFLIPFPVYKKIGTYIPSAVSEFCKDLDFQVQSKHKSPFYVQIVYNTPAKPDVTLVVNGAPLNMEIGYIPFPKEKIHEKLREAKREIFAEQFAFWTKGAVVTSYNFDGDITDIMDWKARFTYLASSGKIYDHEIESPSFYYD